MVHVKVGFVAIISMRPKPCDASGPRDGAGVATWPRVKLRESRVASDRPYGRFNTIKVKAPQARMNN